MNTNTFNVWFDHGLGDCCQFAALMQLYKRRGYDVHVHYEPNKEAVFRASGLPWIELAKDVPYHPWPYLSGFNEPYAEIDGSGNKCYLNLNGGCLPKIGEPDELWEELCQVTLDGRALLDRAEEERVSRFLDNLPRPIIALHTQGTNMTEAKNLSHPTVSELYRRLLAGFGGSLVLLDWDHRVPSLAHARVRHLKSDWDHISTEQLWHLLEQIDLLVGVDSGPLHFAPWSSVPAIGVFHHHYPACVSLPNPRAFFLTRDAPSYRRVNLHRRKRWNIGEYFGTYPSAEDLALHILRGVEGPRYLRTKNRFGRDLQLQQWTRDWCVGATNLSSYADRFHTFDWLLQAITNAFPSPLIVETGCVRSPEDWAGCGNSTYLFGAYLDGLNAGRLISVDNNGINSEFARQYCKDWAGRTEHVTADSVQWLRATEESIDVLYLDSMDTNVPGHAEHALGELQAALPKLDDNALVVFDDTTWGCGWRGKGGLAVPWALQHGWQVAFAGYQTILSRKDLT